MFDIDPVQGERAVFLILTQHKVNVLCLTLTHHKVNVQCLTLTQHKANVLCLTASLLPSKAFELSILLNIANLTALAPWAHASLVKDL